MKLTEDDIYRTSTQYRFWSFTKEQLAAQRLRTNAQATERVKANVARLRAQRQQQADSDSVSSGVENGSGANTPLPDRSSDLKEVDCLTAEEELKLVDEFCERAVALGQHCNFAMEATATGVQFLRRFYLYNSPMTYHGQNISRTTMFLATKTENSHRPLDEFVANFGKVTREQILAPEYIVAQGLRFHLEVKHPFRGLKGAHLEIMGIALGSYEGPNKIDEGMTSADLQARMLKLPSKSGRPVAMSAKDMEQRVNAAYVHASNTLKKVAILTDAYFLYTPSQIWLAAHLLADEPLTLFHISLKVSASSLTCTKLVSTIRSCAALLSSHHTYAPNPERDAKHRAEVKRLIEKLKSCRDPDKVDLVKLNQAQKRDAVKEDGDGIELEESKAKRRKIERETYEKASNEFWGPELKK
ncbi:cyclin-like protein [Setomelanomma holmii]|uniref:RNA polymerase II holoenzyme cyclin-like subunit n=1 Tax=Setomelanomma holmii TaxID=210430 RepID=A0A9P4H0C3_9PLEO|nr:cyclin-like protein [Setomelanomma holmii]